MIILNEMLMLYIYPHKKKKRQRDVSLKTYLSLLNIHEQLLQILHIQIHFWLSLIVKM
jgi:hypothetical protein